MYSFTEKEMSDIMSENQRLHKEIDTMKNDLKYKTEEVEDFKTMLKNSQEAYNYTNSLAIQRSRKITDLERELRLQKKEMIELKHKLHEIFCSIREKAEDGIDNTESFANNIEYIPLPDDVKYDYDSEGEILWD